MIQTYTDGSVVITPSQCPRDCNLTGGCDYCRPYTYRISKISQDDFTGGSGCWIPKIVYPALTVERR